VPATFTALRRSAWAERPGVCGSAVVGEPADSGMVAVSRHGGRG